MEKLLWILFFICAGLSLLFPAYLLFSFIRSWFDKNKTSKISAFEIPISIVIVCYNEADFIREKIQSFLNPDEWIEGSELIVASGGSTDGTALILEEFGNHPDVRLLLSEERLTKIDGVNQAVAISRNEILVFSDCRQRMKPGSVRKLVQHFRDPSIGTVSATLLDRKEGQSASFFRRTLNEIAFGESRFGSSLNIFGALYAQRKSVYRIIPTDILFDDLFVTVSTINQNMRLIQEKEAVIYDLNFKTYYSQERLERLTRGLLIFLYRHFSLIRKLPFSVLIRFLMYKYMKLLLPFFILIALSSALILVYPYMTRELLLLFFAGIILMQIPAKTRNFMQLTMRINFSFMLAVIKFVFFRQRSITWQKLKFDKTDSPRGKN